VASLVDSLGRETVTRLLIFGARIPAEEAPVASLASEVVETGAALETAVGLARRVSSATTEAVAATKQLISEICAEHADLSHWEDRRRALLASEARSRALSRVRELIGSDKGAAASTTSDEPT
jgi:enoyl-CoA hydratase/carnithine racemase